MKTYKELKDELMDEIRRDILVTKVNIRNFTREVAKHRYMGKDEALTALGVSNKRLMVLERNLKMYEEYEV